MEVMIMELVVVVVMEWADFALGLTKSLQGGAVALGRFS